MAVKSRPVVGEFVAVAKVITARSRVSAVSVPAQVEPETRIPERHSASINGVPGTTVPVRSTPAGVRTV